MHANNAELTSNAASESGSNISLVIFDLDGVLVDSEIISALVIIELAREYGIEFDVYYVRRNFIGKSFSTVMGIIEESFDVELPQDFQEKYLLKLGERFNRELKPISGALDLVKDLQVHYCIATSSPLERAIRSLKLTGMLPSFEGHIYCASMVERPKPAPDLFKFACLRENVAVSRALIIEDSVAGLKAGLAAGIRTVRFVGGSHLRGLALVNSPPNGVERTFDSWQQFRSYYPTLFTEA